MLAHFMYNRRHHMECCFLLLLFCLGTFTSSALAQTTPPVVDGNIDDLLHLPQNGVDCILAGNSPEKDVALLNPLLVPCTANLSVPNFGCGVYFANGFDITQFAAAGIGGVLYLGIRAAGQIGDSDGDGTDGLGGNCPPPGLGDQLRDPPGIGEGEQYLWRIDTNCDGFDDLHVTVQGGAGNHQPNVIVTDGNGNPIAGASGVAKYGTTDLEVSVSGLALPPSFSVKVLARSVPSFLSADFAGPVLCGNATVSLAIDSQSPSSTICPGQGAPVTLTVHNTSLVTVKTSLFEELPAGFTFNGVSSGDFTVCSQQGDQVKFCEIDMPAGGSSTVTFQVQAGAGCSGPVENRAWAEGSYTTPCLAEPVTALTDTARVSFDCSGCGSATCNVGGSGGLKTGSHGALVMDRFHGDVGPANGSWQHVERDGGHILFQLESDQAHVTLCTDGQSAPVRESKGAARSVEFGGTGRYSSNGSSEGDACWSARVTDGGAGGEDLYALEVKDCASGATVFSAQGPLDAGNLRIGDSGASAGTASRLEPAGLQGASPEIGLLRPTPNPFTATTRIAYAVTSTTPAQVELVVYSASGRRVRSLFDGTQANGRYETSWDGRDDSSQHVAPGVYFLCVFVNGSRSASGTRLLLMQ